MLKFLNNLDKYNGKRLLTFILKITIMTYFNRGQVWKVRTNSKL